MKYSWKQNNENQVIYTIEIENKIWEKRLCSDVKKTKKALDRLIEEQMEQVLEDGQFFIISDPIYQIKQRKLGKPLIVTGTVTVGAKVSLGSYKEIADETVLEEIKKKTEKKERQNLLIDYINENAKMKIPNEIIEDILKTMIEEYANRLSQQGLSIEQYFQVSQTTMKDLKEQLKPVAVRRIKGQLVLFEIAKRENLIVSEEEIEREIKRLSIRYLMTKEQVKDLIKGKEKRKLRQDLLIQKAYQFVINKNPICYENEK